MLLRPLSAATTKLLTDFLLLGTPISEIVRYFASKQIYISSDRIIIFLNKEQPDLKKHYMKTQARIALAQQIKLARRERRTAPLYKAGDWDEL